jgi:hypothetical protein
VELIERFQRPGAKATTKDYAFVVISVIIVLAILMLPIFFALTLLALIFRH